MEQRPERAHLRTNAGLNRSPRREAAQTMSSITFSRYRHLVITGAKPAPTETQLAVIKALLGANLPASFRDFLKVANGGHLDYVIDVPTGTGNTEEISFDHL